MGVSSKTGGREAVLAAFRQQIDWCRQMASPVTAQVLTLIADDIAADGPAAGLVRDWPGDPLADALPLRFAAAFHALALDGKAPALAACYPPRPAASSVLLRAALRDALVAHDDFVRLFLASPPQTNEVGRSGVLIGGFLTIAAMTRRPLRLLEIGASAGLNLVFDLYRYRLGARTWGDPQSPVLAPAWQGGLPPLDAPLAVHERRACDIAPVDLTQARERLRLKAYVWPDQPERLERLEAAIAVTRAAGHVVERADAAAWVTARLGEPAPDKVSVLYHSIMWQYLPAPTLDAIAAAVERAGARASPAAPLAWLRFEPQSPEIGPELRLTLWPDKRDMRLATAHPHGSAVTWAGI